MSIDPDTSATVFDSNAFAVAKTYAGALVNVAMKSGEADAVVDELTEIEDGLIKTNTKFAYLFSSPTIPSHEKDRILSEVFDGRALPTVVRFLKVLNNHGRLGLIGPIATEARSALDRIQNRITVTVRSAVALDETQQAALREKLVAMTGGTPLLKMEVQPDLLGGLIVQVGDHLFDASVKTQLARLRRDLVEGKIREIQDRRESLIVS